MASIDEKMSAITAPPGIHHASFGEVTYRPGGVLGPRIQGDIQFVILHTGSLTVNVDGDDRDLPADYVACLRPGGRERFSFDAERPSRHTWVALGGDAMGTRRVKRWLAGVPFSLPLSSRMEELLKLGLSVQRTPGPGGGAVLRHLGLAFAAAYRQAAAHRLADRPVPKPVERARRCIESRFTESLTLGDIAAEANLSENHLLRQFARHVGTTPIKYLWQVRVERGARMLRDTGLTITEIAYRTGFTTPYHFSRLVKQRLGLPPRQLRQKYWQQRDGQ